MRFLQMAPLLLLVVPPLAQGAIIEVTAGGEVSEPTVGFADIDGVPIAQTSPPTRAASSRRLAT